MSRLAYLGASEVSAVAGLNPHKSAFELWAEKVGDVPAFEGNIRTKVGAALEEVILGEYAVAAGYTVVRRAAKVTDAPVYHPTIPWLAAHPDGEVLDSPDGPRVVEAKSTSWRQKDRWGEEGTDDIPEEHLVQATMQMACTGHRVCDVPVLFDGEKFAIYTVRWDEAFAAPLLDLAARFWKRVETRDPPPIESAEVALAWLKRKWPAVKKPDLLPSTPDLDGWAARLAQAKAELARWKEEESLAKAHMEKAIEDAKGVRGEGWKAIWYDVRGKEALNLEHLCADLGITPEKLQQHTHRGPGHRSFKFTSKKEKGE